MDDDQNQDTVVPPEVTSSRETPVSDVSSQSTASTPTDMPPEAPESPTNASTKVLIEDQNQGVNQAKSEVPEPSNEAPISAQKKLDKIIMFAQKKKIVVNEEIQMLLHVSSATATRYLVKLVQQGRLARVGNPRDAKYQFLR